MTEVDWSTCTDTTAMLAFLSGKVCDRPLWLFAAACCRRVLRLDPELGGRVVVESTEQLAEGVITRREWEGTIGRITSPLTELGNQPGRTPARRAAYAVANLLYSDAAVAALGTAYHAWAALQLEAYPDTPPAKLNGGPKNVVIVASYPFMAGPLDLRADETDLEPPIPCHPERSHQAGLIRCLVRNPFRPTVIARECCTDTAAALAHQMHEVREFSAMPILADALQDAGCHSADILDHCRGPGPHVRGCWVVDSVLGKQ